jgi:carbon-monoxide dehydrogenase medium subunit
VRLLSATGERTVNVEDLFVEALTTSIQPTELLAEVRVPTRGSSEGCAYEKFPSPASRFAIVGVAAVVGMEGGRIASARVGLTGAASRAQRVPEVERALVGQTGSAIAEAAAQAGTGWVPNEDMDASAEYRQHLARVHVRRALERAISVARGQSQARFGSV